MKCKRNLKKEVKGSVLFTVVAVMAIMMVLVMAALVFSMDATKRSYYDYYESQATYTARSLVESTIESLRSDNGIDLSKEIIDEELKAEPGNIGKPPINLTINGAGTASTGPARLAGYGEVESLTIQLVAIDSKDSYQISTDGENGNGTGNGIYKITAKVKYYTGNAISYSQYVQGSAGNNIIPPVNDGVGGFITLGGYAGNESTGPSINGAAYVNVKFNISDYDGEGMAFLKNDGNFPALSGNGYFNSSVGSNSQAFFVFKKGEGMTVLGSLAFQNMTRFVSEYTPTDVDEAENSRSIPYIYVEDAFCTGAANGSGQITVGSASNPFNIFCGIHFEN